MSAKTTQLTELTTLSGGELFHVVENPATTPIDKQITTANARKYMLTAPGDVVQVYAANMNGMQANIRHGTAGAPVTASGPTLKVSRTEAVTRATIEAAGSVGTDGSDQLAAIIGVNSAVAGSQTQPVGVLGAAKNASTEAGVSNVDACGLYGVGMSLSGNLGSGIGGFVLGRRDADTGRACGLEVNVYNGGASDSAYVPSGNNPVKGIWLNAGGTADSGGGIVLSNTTGRQFEVGLAFTAQVAGGKTGGVREASIRDDSTSARSLYIKGTHATAAIGIDAGSGYVGIGTASPGAVVHVVSPASGVTSAKIVVGASQASVNPALVIRNSADSGSLFDFSPFGHARSGGGSTDFPSFSHVSDSNSGYGLTAADGLYLSTGGIVRQRLDNAGVQFGPTLALGGGVGVVGITDATTAPTTNPTGGGVLYAEGGILKWRATNGIVTTIDTAAVSNTQTASYTLVLADAGKVIEMNVAGANNLTVPPNSSVAFPVGTVIEVFQVGAGATTLVAGAGVTLRPPPGGTLISAGQYASLSLRKRATDEWAVAGATT